ncbi:hypothetical protein, partial [Martelella alba]|uniref:hypothetical protein n=1 Tax=Martelella alba TaxID=2590451 RepID=UPI001E527A02
HTNAAYSAHDLILLITSVKNGGITLPQRSGVAVFVCQGIRHNFAAVIVITTLAGRFKIVIFIAQTIGIGCLLGFVLLLHAAQPQAQLKCMVHKQQ